MIDDDDDAGFFGPDGLYWDDDPAWWPGNNPCGNPHDVDETETWRTKEGDLLRFADMSDSHLANTLAMCIRNGDRLTRSRIRAMLAELTRRGN